jgi:phosphoribosylanthranilate isomerase
MKVKTCGAMTEIDIRAAKLAGADSVGVISPPPTRDHYPRSKNSHTVSSEQAIRMRTVMPEGLEFVWLPRHKPNFNEIVDFVELLKPDRIQLSEAEGPKLAVALHDYYGGADDTPRIARVIHVSDKTSPSQINVEGIDYIHLDSAGDRPGGNGVGHDLSISGKIAERAHSAGTAVILAGGLTVGTVAEAIAAVQPDEVDVESGIRSSFDSFSQIEIQRFVRAAHDAGEQI